MLISGVRVLNADKYLENFPNGELIRVLVPTALLKPSQFKRTGFQADVKSGDAILPPITGSVTRFNAEGKWEIHKHLPKESRYLYSRLWTWKQWSGRNSSVEVEKFCDIYRECYQRSLIGPPSELVHFFVTTEGEFFSSREIPLNEYTKTDVQHIINMFLEIFGVCEIRKNDFSSFLPQKIRHVHWKILPVGMSPWERVSLYAVEKLRRRSEARKKVILERQKILLSYGAEEVAIGSGGFNDYIGYIYPNKEFVILESLISNNATYVFDRNWEEVAKLSKKEILKEGFHRDRIIHSKGWRERLDRLFEYQPADANLELFSA